MKIRNRIDGSKLRELFDYANGRLIWKIAVSNVPKGTLAGYEDHRGYFRVGINGKNYLLHRLIWAWHFNDWPDYLDHIDNNPANNKIDNLRPVSQADNLVNSSVVRNKTGFRGVGYHGPTETYTAKITRNGMTKSLGYYGTAEEASLAYQTAKERLYNAVFGH